MNILTSLISLIFPSPTEIKELESLTPADVIEHCQPSAKPLPPHIHALFNYHDRVIRRAVWTLKYEGNRTIAALFATLIYDSLIETLSDNLLYDNFTSPILIPIPSSSQRKHERGWNQTVMLAHALENIEKGNNIKNFTVHSSLLIKIRHTEAQAKLSEKRRRENLKNCFAVQPKLREFVKNKNIILLDDVTTTGSTLLEAATALRAAGAKKIICFAVAH